MLEQILESPFGCKEIKPVNPKGNKPWIFIGRTDAEAPILWPSNAKSWLIVKDPDVGKDRRQEEKGMTEDEIVRWHYWLSGHEFEQVLGDGEGQRSLACCSSWGHNESDTTERLKETTKLSAFSAVNTYMYMATHSSVLAWIIPGTGEPGGLLSMGSHRVRHDWGDLAAAYLKDKHFTK